jgi:hypothetical protein
MIGCLQIEISTSARSDLLAGYDFYESQQAGLGEYFVDSVLSDIEGLLIHAGVHIRTSRSIYRSLGSKFPFGIYYRLNGANNEVAQVIAILDTRQKPMRIRSTLKQRV